MDLQAPVAWGSAPSCSTAAALLQALLMLYFTTRLERRSLGWTDLWKGAAANE
jgi:hypothetical protein